MFSRGCIGNKWVKLTGFFVARNLTKNAYVSTLFSFQRVMLVQTKTRRFERRLKRLL